MTTIRFLFLALAVLLLTGCATLERSWPKPQIAYTHAATPAQAAALVNAWVATPGHSWTHALGTGSMRPYIHGGPREFLLQENYSGQPIVPGHVVTFNRGDAPCCMHLVAATRANGQWLYISGTNNRRSDGWYHISTVSFILRRVVTLPGGVTPPDSNISSPGRALTGQ